MRDILSLHTPVVQWCGGVYCNPPLVKYWKFKISTYLVEVLSGELTVSILVSGRGSRKYPEVAKSVLCFPLMIGIPQ